MRILIICSEPFENSFTVSKLGLMYLNRRQPLQLVENLNSNVSIYHVSNKIKFSGGTISGRPHFPSE